MSRENDFDEMAERRDMITDALLDLVSLVELAATDRAGLARAVRRLAYAEGEEETGVALKQVAAAAVAWGLRLSGEDPPSAEDVAEAMSDG